MGNGMSIDNWIQRITTPRQEINGLPVCPYAKGAEYEIIDTDGSNINPPPWNFELIIYRLPDHYLQSEVEAISIEYNKIFPDMVFLPDPKDKNTFINGVQTNNGMYNLILCQWRDELDNARDKLKKTTYYSFWNQEYLKEILET
jgi:hypothetical protein